MAYNPGIQYRGDQYLAQGISRFGEQMGDALRQYGDDKKEIAGLDAAAEDMMEFRKTLGLEPIDPKVIKTYSGGGLSVKKSLLGQWTARTVAETKGKKEQDDAEFEREKHRAAEAQNKFKRKQMLAESARGVAREQREVLESEQATQRFDRENRLSQNLQRFQERVGNYIPSPRHSRVLPFQEGKPPQYVEVSKGPEMDQRLLKQFAMQEGVHPDDMAGVFNAYKPNVTPEIMTLPNGEQIIFNPKVGNFERLNQNRSLSPVLNPNTGKVMKGLFRSGNQFVRTPKDLDILSAGEQSDLRMQIIKLERERVMQAYSDPVMAAALAEEIEGLRKILKRSSEAKTPSDSRTEILSEFEQWLKEQNAL